jgi:DNA gyrase subunit B
VDGAHIRTLLLTFFYRKMPELIEKGYVYLAQPPLYKVERKKKTEYVLTDGEMTQRLLLLGLDDMTLKRADGTPLEKDAAKDLLRLLSEIEQTCKMLEERGFAPRNLLDDEHAVGSGASMLRKQMTSLAGMGFSRADYFGHPPIREALPDGTPALYPTVASVEEDKEVKDVYSLPALLEAVRTRGRKGLVIMRFKGLGEMDAEELYDTTMDPAKRHMIRVQLSDAVKADRMFTLLMGDEVEPRRRFIEENALNVRNLDF